MNSQNQPANTSMIESMYDLTVGVELEFLCVFREDAFYQEGKKHDVPKNIRQFHGLNLTLCKELNRRGVPTKPWLGPGKSYPDPVPFSRWAITWDVCDLSDEEANHLGHSQEEEPVELISRKFRLFHDDWRAEIKTVLDTLKAIEIQYGCRFITNRSTGLHVHVGYDTHKVPLRTAKNVFQLATAFERCLDELHTTARADYLEDEEKTWNHYPPSYFHHFGPISGKRTCIFERLANIEDIDSYQQLSQYFNIYDAVKGDCSMTGHNSAYNFDNLFLPGKHGEYESDILGTIEFRQHCGSLDYLTIINWVLLTCKIVIYCSSASPEDMVKFCVLAAGPYRVRDLFKHIGLPDHVVNFYIGTIGCTDTSTNNDFQEEDYNDTIGVLGEVPVGQEYQHQDNHPMVSLVEQNDAECAERVEPEALAKIIQEKLLEGVYGIDLANPNNNVWNSRHAASLYAATLPTTQQYFGGHKTEEQTASITAAQVYRTMAMDYVEGGRSRFVFPGSGLDANLEEDENGDVEMDMGIDEGDDL